MPNVDEELQLDASVNSYASFPSKILRKPTSSFDNRDVCLFTVYAPDGNILPCILEYIKCLKKADIDVIVCIAINSIDINIQDALTDAAVVFVRQNGGYDFGIWADALKNIPEVWNAKRLIFANDSAFVLPDAFDNFFNRVRLNKSDYIALTDAYTDCYHTQSYFFILQGESLKHEDVHNFWMNIKNYQTKEEVIQAYEVPMYDMFKIKFKLSVDILFSYQNLFPNHSPQDSMGLNPTHFFWDHLIMNGMPFIKAELLRDNPMGMQLAHVDAILRNHGSDPKMVKEHIAKSRKLRTSGNSDPSSIKNIIREINQILLKARRWRRGKY